VGWSRPQRARVEREQAILGRYFPTQEWYDPTEPSKTFIDG